MAEPIMKQSLSEAVIIDAVRTPMGKGRPGGSLSGVHPMDLLVAPLRAIVERTGLDPNSIDDVIAGCVCQVGEQSSNVARRALLAAGYPERVPGVTLDRKCGSSQQAVHFAAQGIMSGFYDVVVACGLESMSRVPMGSYTLGLGDEIDGEAFTARYPHGLVSQGVASELIAAKFGLTRTELDAYAARSQTRAAAARDEGRYDHEMIPIKVSGPDGVNLVNTDEGIRTSTVESLAHLKTVFASEEVKARFPQVEFSTTAGNSSQITDGASAVLVTSADKAKELGLTPRARIVSMAVEGDDPFLMLTGVIPATRKVLDHCGLTLDDIDLFEVNEAFATVVLAWAKELGVDLDQVNVNGGAIALGHPTGASGARIMATLLNALEQRQARFGLQVMCEGGGMANATIIERL